VVTKYTCVVDNNIDAAEVIQRGLNDFGGLRRGAHRVGVSDSVSALRSDLIDDLLGRTGAGTLSGDAATDIVYDDPSAA
jgi:hypothetical protein